MALAPYSPSESQKLLRRGAPTDFTNLSVVRNLGAGQHYNEYRPHSTLGRMTPPQFKDKLLQQIPDKTIVPQE
jgi:hypothetical protein